MVVNTGEYNKWTIILVLPISCIKGKDISKNLKVHSTFPIAPKQSLKPFILIKGVCHKHKRVFQLQSFKILDNATSIGKKLLSLFTNLVVQILFNKANLVKTARRICHGTIHLIWSYPRFSIAFNFFNITFTHLFVCR